MCLRPHLEDRLCAAVQFPDVCRLAQQRDSAPGVLPPLLRVAQNASPPFVQGQDAGEGRFPRGGSGRDTEGRAEAQAADPGKRIASGRGRSQDVLKAYGASYRSVQAVSESVPRIRQIPEVLLFQPSQSCHQQPPLLPGIQHRAAFALFPPEDLLRLRGHKTFGSAAAAKPFPQL